MPKNTFTVVFDKTCDIGNFRARAHFLPLDDAQELSKKHNEAGPPEQPPADGCHQSVTDTLDNVKIDRANEHRKGHFGKSV